jgi:hypothetical protein
MPCVFADEHRCATPPGVERLNASAGFDESFLVKDTICRKKNLAMDVADAGVVASQGGVETGIVESVAVHLVKAEGDVKRRYPGFFVLLTQVLEEL